MPEKKKRKRKFLIFFIILLIIILILIVYSPLILVHSLPVIFDKFYDRKLTFAKVQYSVIESRISIGDIKFSDKQGKMLFGAREIFIELNKKKLLNSKLVFSSILIDSPETFLEKKGNSYGFPNYLNLKKKEGRQGFFFNLPFSIEQVEIKNARLNLRENNSLKDMLTGLYVFIPGINQGQSEIKPVIRGKIKGRQFELKGTTYLEKDSLKNRFTIKLDSLNLADFSPYMPPIRNIRIASGLGSARVNLEFTTYKNKTPSLVLNGDVYTTGLYLKDIVTGLDFIRDFDGYIKINNFDVFNTSIEIEKLSATKGTLVLAYSKNQSATSSVLVSNKKSKSKFKSVIKNAYFDNFNVVFHDKIHEHRYDFFGVKLSIINFSNYLDTGIDFYVTSRARGIEILSARGIIDFQNKDITIDNLEAVNLDTSVFKVLPDSLDSIRSLNLSYYKGDARINKDLISFKGKVILSDMDIMTKNSLRIEAAKITTVLEEIEFKKNKFSFGSIECEGLSFPVNGSDEKKVKNLDFVLPRTDTPYSIDYSKKENAINIKGNFPVTAVSGDFNYPGGSFSFNIDSVLVIPSVTIKNGSPVELTARGSLELSNLALFDGNIPVFKVEKLGATIDKIRLFPVFISIGEISLNKFYSSIEVKANRKLYLFSIFELKAGKKTGNKIQVNIDMIKLNNGKIDFTDLSLNNLFNIELTDMNGEVVNFPSNVYPQGKLTMLGKINGRNDIGFSGKIGTETGIEGELVSRNILLKQFSPYSEKYLSYGITGGFMDIDSSFSIKGSILNMNINLVLDNLNLFQANPAGKAKADLSRLITYAENSEGRINLNIPIKGILGDPEVDFRRIFFNVFLDILGNSGKTIMNQLANFREDGTIEIIYFKPGLDQLVINEDKIFSKEFLDRLGNKKKTFLIEGYVDRDKDGEVIKRAILEEKIALYSTGSGNNETGILKKIYESYSNNEPPDSIDDESLRKSILEKITVDESRYYSLSYARINKIRNLLTDKYEIEPKRILINEKSIYENPYISGIDNTIVVIKSGEYLEK